MHQREFRRNPTWRCDWGAEDGINNKKIQFVPAAAAAISKI